MSKARVELPPKLIPVFLGDARYRGAYGGRGSAKTRSFAKMAAVKGLQFASDGRKGIILCGREFQNSLSESSFAEVKTAIIDEPWLSDFYEIGERYIKTKCGNVSFAFAGLRHNIDSIKSKSKILIIWVDEAEPVSEAAWRKIIPTVREQGSEIWVTWNPERESSATHIRFRKDPPSNSKIVEISYKDNPWFFNTPLEKERLDDLEKRPDQYGHIWDGEMITVVEGAYLAKHIEKAKSESRYSTERKIEIPEDPLLTIRLFADIGGTGAKADNFVFWAAQFSGQKINWVNHYEKQGQPIGAHLDWLRSQGYTPERAKIWLPHDGSQGDKVFAVTYESAFKKAGYEVVVIPNQGKGAAMKRVEQMRNLFGNMWFNYKCQPGQKALAWYHEKIDENRRIGLGPEHDWSSHSFDAAGLGAVVYRIEEDNKQDTYNPDEDYNAVSIWK